MRNTASLLAVFIATGWTLASFAEPPSHAPAHGWREKHDPYYIGYTGTKWEHDYEVQSGRCNREAVGAALGGVAGGVIGRNVADRDERVVGTIIGAAVGALIGARIGRDMDDRDRACVGHALEIGAEGRRVVWSNGGTGVRYELIPGGRAKGKKRGNCRDFTIVAVAGGAKSLRRATACQNDPGVWLIATI